MGAVETAAFRALAKARSDVIEYRPRPSEFDSEAIVRGSTNLLSRLDSTVGPSL